MAKPAAKKRARAKAVRKMERLESQSYELTPADAITFRAPSARSSYLSQDHVDLDYGGKEIVQIFISA